MAIPTIFIDQQTTFDSFCQQCRQQVVIAIDTEFIRSSTFFAKPGLFQVNNGLQIGLIDPLAIEDWQAFIAILEDPKLCKVMHACDEDVELFYHFFSAQPKNVFDTQFAAAVLGEEHAMSYLKLVQLYLDITIEKDQRRTNWLKRPLAEEQLHYAAADVAYLLQVYQQQVTRLEQSGKLPLVQAHFDELFAVFLDASYQDAVWRIGDAWRLNPLQFARLKALAAWRESKMREKDLPRKRIAENQALLSLAKQDSWNTYQMFAVEGLPAQTVKQLGEEILALLVQVNQGGEYSERMYKPINDGYTRRIKKALEDIAKQEQMAPLLLIKKSFVKLLRQQLREKQDALPSSISGWRRPYYQRAFATIIQFEDKNIE